MVNKLDYVRNKLESNPNVLIIDVFDRGSGIQPEDWNDEVPTQARYVRHWFDFIVAPDPGIGHVDDLNKFMGQLIPGLEPTMQDRFYETGRDLELGKLYFDEAIGQEKVITRREVSFSDEEYKNLPGFEGGKRVIETEEIQSYDRRIFVRLYPNDILARKVVNRATLDAETDALSGFEFVPKENEQECRANMAKLEAMPDYQYRIPLDVIADVS